MQITTSRLILRPLTAEDGPALAAATDESWGELSQWMRWATDRSERTNVANCSLYTKLCEDKFLSKQDFVFGGFSKETGEFILTLRLSHLDRSKNSYEFCGYWCRTSQQNKGYMTEAVKAVIDYALDELKASHLQIKHAAGNHATRIVMDRAGFIEESILKNAHQLPDGSMFDEHVLSLRR